MEVGDQVLSYDNTIKRENGASLKPVFKGSYNLESKTSNSVKTRVKGGIENHHRRFIKKGKMTLFFTRANSQRNNLQSLIPQETTFRSLQ